MSGTRAGAALSVCRRDGAGAEGGVVCVNTTGTNATATLANMSAQIEALKQQRVGLAEPLETQIRELNPSWKPTSLRPKADDTVVEILTAEGQPMSTEEIVEAVGDLFTPWKIKNT